MVRRLLIKRLKEYYKLERFHTIWISLFCVFLNFKYGWKQSLLLNYSIAIIVFILFQGTYYWKAKFDKISNDHVNLNYTYKLFKIFIIINSILIALFPILIMILILGNNFDLQENKIWAAFSYLFAIAEHINYYYIQLMYDNKNDYKYLRKYKRLKISAIRKDFQIRKF